MVVAYYILGAALAAWLTTGSGRLDWKLSILVLPLMYLAHLCHKAIASRCRKSAGGIAPARACLYLSGRNWSGCRRLGGHRFCSVDHENAYLAELEKLAVQRLRSACSAVPAGIPNAPNASAACANTTREIRLRRAMNRR